MIWIHNAKKSMNQFNNKSNFKMRKRVNVMLEHQNLKKIQPLFKNFRKKFISLCHILIAVILNFLFFLLYFVFYKMLFFFFFFPNYLYYSSILLKISKQNEYIKKSLEHSFLYFYLGVSYLK